MIHPAIEYHRRAVGIMAAAMHHHHMAADYHGRGMDTEARRHAMMAKEFAAEAAEQASMAQQESQKRE